MTGFGRFGEECVAIAAVVRRRAVASSVDKARRVVPLARMSSDADSAPAPEAPPPDGLVVETHYVRGRNAVFARASFTLMYVDYFLHQADHGLKPEPAHAAVFKEALAAFTLFCASRPKNELTAWTLHFEEPLFNLFLIGDNDTGGIAGRTFDENVKRMEGNQFFSDVVRGKQPPRRSTIAFEGADALRAVEAFYTNSEQRPARLFRLADEEFAIVCSHPDFDAEWLKALDADAVRRIPETEQLGLLERRLYKWECGCSEKKIMGVLAPSMRSAPDELFGGDPSVQVRCPRCGARYTITREALEAFLAAGGGGGGA